VGLGVKLAVGVSVGRGVQVKVGVEVGVEVGVAEGVCVRVAVWVKVEVNVAVGVEVGVLVALEVQVNVEGGVMQEPETGFSALDAAGEKAQENINTNTTDAFRWKVPRIGTLINGFWVLACAFMSNLALPKGRSGGYSPSFPVQPYLKPKDKKEV
jgi:hypothetical protein